MRLGCPECGARYEVAETAIPPAGRELHCSACDHRWFFRPPIGEAPAPRTVASEPLRPRPTDPAVLQILREEAERELAARRREAEAAANRRTAELPATPAAPAPVDPVPADPTPPRRALLPEIDETGVPQRLGGAGTGTGTIVVHAPPEAPRSGFGAGFAVALAVAAVGATAYAWSAELAAAVPALAAPLEGWVAAVDAARVALHNLLG